jgi:hypothetical protein
MSVNRDVNASRNILEILRAMVDGLERPEPFAVAVEIQRYRTAQRHRF